MGTVTFSQYIGDERFVEGPFATAVIPREGESVKVGALCGAVLDVSHEYHPNGLCVTVVLLSGRPEPLRP